MPAPTLSPLAHEVMKKRYLARNYRGQIIETPVDVFARVARAVAEADRLFDAEASIGEFNMEMVGELQMLGPFGQGNPEPVFATRGVRLAAPPRRVGAAGDHLQLTITDGLAAVRCIGFRMGKLEKKLIDSEFFDVAYQPQINTYNGNTNVQFVLADVQFE